MTGRLSCSPAWSLPRQPHRGACLPPCPHHQWARAPRWIAIASAAAGCGIWAAHLIAMLAGRPGIALGYDIVLAALSLLPPWRSPAPVSRSRSTTRKSQRALRGHRRVGGGVRALPRHFGNSPAGPDRLVVGRCRAVGRSRPVLRKSLACRRHAPRRDERHHYRGHSADADHSRITSPRCAPYLLPDLNADASDFLPMSFALLIASTALGVLGVSLAAAVADRRQRGWRSRSTTCRKASSCSTRRTFCRGRNYQLQL